MKVIAPITLLLAATPAVATSLVGSPVIIDGDTLEIAGKHVRLFAIDAPESTQTCDRNGERWACGRAAGDALRAMIWQRHGQL